MCSDTIRPTKKQREILTYIEGFITEHGYSPSYREIMNGLDYTSVATVSLHVNSLIRRGHLRKRDHSARSLEVVAPSGVVHADDTAAPADQPGQETWLVQKVEDMFSRFEQAGEAAEHTYDEMAVMVNALRVLGLEAAASAFMPRLAELRHKATTDVAPPQEVA